MAPVAEIARSNVQGRRPLLTGAEPYTVLSLCLHTIPVGLQVAILCNHQRSVPKTHTNQMEKIQEKLSALNTELKELEEELRAAQKGKAGADGKKQSVEG